MLWGQAGPCDQGAAAGALTSAAGEGGPREGGAEPSSERRAGGRRGLREERASGKARHSHLPTQAAHSGLFPSLPGVRQCLGRPKPRPQMARTTTTSSRITGHHHSFPEAQCAASVPTGNGAGRGAAADGRDAGNAPLYNGADAAPGPGCRRPFVKAVVVICCFHVSCCVHGGCPIADGKHFVNRFAACKGSPSISLLPR